MRARIDDRGRPAPTRAATRRRGITAALALAIGSGCSGEPPSPAAADLASTDPIVRRYVSEIAPVLLESCADCHHAGVEPPWYASLPGLGPWIQQDVERGRQRLDLSLPFPFVGERDAGPSAYLIALRTSLLDRNMPPTVYLLTHPTASLSEAERDALFDWIEAALDSVAEPSPPPPGSFEHATSVVANRCARCHRDGVAGEMNGDFSDVADLAWLVEDGEYIDPDDPEASTLWERVASEDDPMPPSPHDRLAPEELASLRSWLESGAPVP